jgi:ComF family protein
VCDACLEAIRALPADQQSCSVCGERLLRPADHAELLGGGTKCQACLEHQPTFDKAGYYGAYDAGLRELIHLLKYERVRPAADLLGRMVGDVVHDMHPKFGAEPPLVIPVPLHESKLRARGFNQSELIARAAVKAASLRAVINTSALDRIRDTGSQTGLTRRQRQENMRGAFAVVRPDQIAGRDILLVDDVFTTGTTVSECARVLKKARAAHVYVATVARVLLPDGRGVDPVLEATFAAEGSSKPMTRAAHS